MNAAERHIESTLNEREMRVEHSINLVRMGVFGFGMAADVLSAAVDRLLSPEYLVFAISGTLFAAAYLAGVHVASRGTRYRGWLKYVTVTVDCLLPAAFLLEMTRSRFAGRIDMQAVASVTAVVIVIVIMLNALRLRTGSVVYGTALGAAVVAASTAVLSREPVTRIWLAPLVVVSGLVTWWVSRNVRSLIQALRRRERLARFLPAELVAMVEGSDLDLTLGGKSTRITVLFADIRGFTSFSETRAPEEVVEILNEYFTAMSGCILANGGMIDKYIGDAVMAVFGAPLPREGDASRAVAAARAMLGQLAVLNDRWARSGRPELSMGIALHTGAALAGNIGAPERMDYTVIGDTVNLTARLEELNKKYHTSLIMSEETCREAAVRPEPLLLGEVTLRGREEPVRVYTLPAAGR